MSEQPACDLVMKGGITSGIVYPPAVLELHKTYRFKNIGGTSAGAMAAAATAAAEHNPTEDGFQELSRIREELSTDGYLLNLFQPQEATRPLFDVLIEMLRVVSPPPTSNNGSGATTQKVSSPPLPLFLRLLRWLLSGTIPANQADKLDKSLQVVNALSRKWADPKTCYPSYIDGGRRGLFIAGGGVLLLLLLPSLALLSFTISMAFSEGVARFWLPIGLFVLLTALLVALASWIGLWAGRVLGVASNLPRQLTREHFYGICSGHSPVPDKQNDHSNLTDWLSHHLDSMAGLSVQPEQAASSVSTPLTFKHLRMQDVNLEMVTSNISLGQPCVMPQDLANYIFNKDEWYRLFPQYIVDHMLANPPGDSLVDTKLLPEGYHFLPDQEDLPAIVCTRMSLSFPFLLCAVPLYTLSTEAVQRCQNGHRLNAEQDLQQHWFSDGGICSNFPIHFFDAWLPTRPTFGINLTGKPDGTSVLVRENVPDFGAGSNGTGNSVKLPPADQLPAPEWHEIDQIVAFGHSLFGTAQNYRDALQSQLPSYRERIVQIRLDDNEGGMHLTMDPATIENAAQKGKDAADLLSHFDFEQHWWVRFLVLMGRLEDQFEHLQRFFESTTLPTVAQRIQRACENSESPYPYPRTEQWCQEAICRMALLENFIRAWQQACKDSEMPRLFRDNGPLPEPVLQVAPEL